MRPLLHLFLIALIWGAYQTNALATTAFVSKSVKTGDHVIAIMRKHGFEPAEREAALRQEPALMHLLLHLDSVYLVAQSARETSLRFYDERRTRAWTITRNSGGVSVREEQPEFKVERESFSGAIQGSIYQSINRSTGSSWVATRFMDAYRLQLDLNRIPRGSSYRLTVERMYDDGVFVGFGEVLDALLDTTEQRIRKIFVRHEDWDGGVFVAKSDLQDDRPFYSPVAYMRVSSMFQPRRRHPVTKRIQAHNGVDFELEEGAPIFAPRGGVVLRKGKQRAAGLYVVISHAGGYETAYNHLSEIEPGLEIGASVLAGQKIGGAGCTGYCTKTHLHFAMKKNGRWIDPAKYIRSYPAPFNRVVSRLDLSTITD